MSTTQTIRPSANLATTGWTIGGGILPATHWEAVSQDETLPHGGFTTYGYIRSAAGASPANARFSMSTYVMAVDERCKRARLKTHGRTTHSGVSGRGMWGSGSETLVGPTFNNTSSVTLGTGAWYSSKTAVGYTAPNEWNQAAIDAMQCAAQVYLNIEPTGYTEFWELYVELDIVKQADVTWDNSFFTADVTQRPHQKWNFIGNGEVQKLYQVKIFTEAQTLVGGFDPDVDVPVWDSGQITSTVGNTNPGVDLTNNVSYRSYIKVAKDFNGTDWWSAAWVASNVYTVAELPTTVVTAPTGAIATNQPTFTWTFADNNGTAVVSQHGYEMKLYRKVAGAWPAGFPGDGATFDAAVTAGDLVLDYSKAYSFSAVTALTVMTMSLVNAGDFRTYIRTAKLEQDPGFAGLMYSPWAYLGFTTSFAQPPLPLISVIQDPVKPTDHLITVTPQAGVPGSEYFNLYRSIDGNAYEPFHIGGGISSMGLVMGSATVFRDTEAPQNVLVSYAVESVDTGLGTPVSSDLAIDDITNEVNQVWLKKPMAPELDLRLPTENVWLEITQVRPRTVHAPLGRNSSVVVHSATKYDSLSLTVVVLTRDIYEALQALLDNGYVFFLQTPKESWYCQISGDVQEQAHLWDGLHGEEDVWKFTLPFVEVGTDAGI